MAGVDLGLDLIEAPQREPGRSVPRALAYGCLAGACAAMAYILSILDTSKTVTDLIAALAAGELGEFAAGLVTVAIFLSWLLVFGLLLAMPTAFPFIVFMTWIEAKSAVSRRFWTWLLMGAVFSLPAPAGLWFASLGSPGSGGVGAWEMSLIGLNFVCGSIGGLAAWLGYYRPVKSDP